MHISISIQALSLSLRIRLEEQNKILEIPFSHRLLYIILNINRKT